MMRQRRLEIALVLALGVGLVAALGMLIRQSGRLAEGQRQRAADLESLRELREALRQRGLQNPPPEAVVPAPAADYQAALAQRDATIAQLTRELSDARATVTGLEAQLVNSNDELEGALTNANERHRKEREDWQNQLSSLKQQLDSAQAQAEASRERIAALEADNAKARSDNTQGTARAAELERIVADLQDLNRRRDTYLTSIMRRYRDISNQFRAMSGILESTRDQNSTAFSNPALSRIQDTVSLADEDLRQLNDLNDQARQLEKKLAKK